MEDVLVGEGTVTGALERLFDAMRTGVGQREAAEDLSRVLEAYEADAEAFLREHPISSVVQTAVTRAMERYADEMEALNDAAAAEIEVGEDVLQVLADHRKRLSDAQETLNEALALIDDLDRFEKASGRDVADEMGGER